MEESVGPSSHGYSSAEVTAPIGVEGSRAIEAPNPLTSSTSPPLPDRALPSLSELGLDDSGAPNSRSRSYVTGSPTMMRIAVAGSNSLAFSIAYYIQEETAHQVILLSRTVQPAVTSRGIQVQIIDYHSSASLAFALAGIDTIISTVTGVPQLSLIDAALKSRVRRFAPAEFEGPPSLRPANNPFDAGRAAARALLAQNSTRIETTSFVCGILYERFQPGGLAVSGLGLQSALGAEGSYMMNLRAMSAEIPLYNPLGQYASVCLTSTQDVGRFVARALELDNWPVECRMFGERMTVYDLVALVQGVRNMPFQPLDWHVNVESIQSQLDQARLAGDKAKEGRTLALLATAEGRFDYSQAELNMQFPEVKAVKFRDWLLEKWALL